MNIPKFDRALIEKCQRNAPRYTSYPTADRFVLDYDIAEHSKRLSEAFDSDVNSGISLYLHIPFCNTLCLFCGCNKIITNDRSRVGVYLDYLEREIVNFVEKIKKRLPVVQLHFGGGSPSWMSNEEVTRVMQMLSEHFDLSKSQEIALEIDPRHVDEKFLDNLMANGFNRISLGVQDLNYEVQKRINRIQPLWMTERLINHARSIGFRSTNIDLIYGLPRQTKNSFIETLKAIIDLNPERLALFNYAHIPNSFMPQTRIKEDELPDSREKLDILEQSVAKLTESGYVFIGMDHFASADDELAIALKNGTLQRNFQGYSTYADTQMVSFGVSAIGYIGNSYYQNVKDLATYYERVSNQELPILRGVSLSKDDLLRKHIIQQIMCQFKLDFKEVSARFGVVFDNYFAHEILQLNELVAMGLIEVHTDGFIVTSRGRFLIRNVALIFDRYLRDDSTNSKLIDIKVASRYSKVI